SFAYGGTVEVYVYRILGLDWFGGDVNPAMNIFKLTLPLFGALFAAGVIILIYDLFTLGERTAEMELDSPQAVSPVPPATGWRRPLTGFETGIWLLFMWLCGALITFCLLSFNLSQVRNGADPSLPYLLAGVGYPGLFVVTVGFVARFIASLGARLRTDQAPLAPLDLSAQA